jgi:hypothetical protein
MGAFDDVKIAPGLPRAERIKQLALTAAKVFDAPGVSVWHPKLDAAQTPFKIFSFAPTAERKYAIYMTLGASDSRGMEFMCFTKAVAKDPANDPWAWLVGATGAYSPAPGAKLSILDTVPLTPGMLKETAHEFVALAPPAFLPPQLIKDYAKLFGAELVMIVPITKTERAFAMQKGTQLLFTKMIAQAVEPYADRKPGLTSL